jgi:truncated hemoglobin YjbI
MIGGNTQNTVRSGLPATLYEKLGSAEGMKIFVDKVFTKVLDDATLRPFFVRQGGIDVELIKQHFSHFMSHLTNTTEGQWTGRPLNQVHRHFPITDEMFDSLNSHCVSAVKEMKKLKIDGLKEMIKLL